MTLEESKIEIQDIIDIYEKEDMYPLLKDRQISALKTAISALQAQDVPDIVEDTISRQAAIDAIHQYFADGFEEDRWWNSTHVLAALEDLPSAQPEPCGDAVSRQYILDVLAEYIEEYREVDEKGNHDPKWCAMKEAEMVVKEAPSVKPEIIHCRECQHHRRDNTGCYYCVRKEYGYGWGLNDFCSDAERRTDE